MRAPTFIAFVVLAAAIVRGTFVDDIRGLATLHDDGLLTDSEYAAAKRLAIAAAFPPPSPSSGNTTDGPYVTIDCGSSDRKKILTAVLPLKSSKPIDLRSQSLCPEVIGEGGFTEALVPLNIPQ